MEGGNFQKTGKSMQQKVVAAIVTVINSHRQ